MSKDQRRPLFCCYLLSSINPKHKNSTYIGFTVDPERRLKQHNGEIKNGANKTRKKRPWENILVVHGFPNKISALHFEWAWQNPSKSRLLKKAGLTIKRPIGTNSNLKVLFRMLSILPWVNFPLKLNWSKMEFKALEGSFLKSEGISLPEHVETTVCRLKQFSERVRKDDLSLILDIDEFFSDSDICKIKLKVVNNPKKAKTTSFGMNPVLKQNESPSKSRTIKNLCCPLCRDSEGLNFKREISFCENCHFFFHVVCLAKRLTEKECQIIPKDGICSFCSANFSWSKVVENSFLSSKIKKKVLEKNLMIENEEEVVNKSFNESVVNLLSDESLNELEKSMGFDVFSDSDLELKSRKSLRDRLME